MPYRLFIDDLRNPVMADWGVARDSKVATAILERDGWRCSTLLRSFCKALTTVQSVDIPKESNRFLMSARSIVLL